MTTTKHNKSQHFYLIGIGGIGMSGIARLLLAMGHRVSGADIKSSPLCKRLEEEGMTLYYGHDAENMKDVDTVVVSSAIRTDNPEIKEAKRKKIPVRRRAEMLNEIMSPAKARLGVAGTHGKTTTTSMTIHIMDAEKAKMGYLLGALRNGLETNAELKGSDIFLTEADESDGSFLCLDCNHVVITNIEEEHMAFFKTKANLIKHFRDYVANCVERKGTVFYNGDDPLCVEVCSELPEAQALSFGTKKSNQIQATNIRATASGMRFKVKAKGKEVLDVALPVFGQHNVFNALGAISVSRALGATDEGIVESLAGFQGSSRRFQKVGEVNDIKVYDDYAHHPTEIQTTLDGTRNSFKGRIICIFQPHRYSRTKNHMAAFSKSFVHADRVILTDIYAASETEIPGINSARLATLIKGQGVKVQHIPKVADISEKVLKQLIPGDIVITMGAGNINEVAYQLRDRLHQVHLAS